LLAVLHHHQQHPRPHHRIISSIRNKTAGAQTDTAKKAARSLSQQSTDRTCKQLAAAQQSIT
jgi:hypothetical protein